MSWSTKAKVASGLAAAAIIAAAAYFLFLPKSEAPGPDSGGANSSVRGQVGQAETVPAPAALASSAETPAEPKAASPAAQTGANASQSPASGLINEDKTVTFDFVEDVARFLLEKYRPALPGGQGSLALTFSKLNARYGISPTGMAQVPDSIQKTRQALLDYILAPERLSHLFQTYADPFVTMLIWCSENIEKDCPAPGGGQVRRLLTPAETAEMLRLYAGLARRSAVVLSTLAAHPEMGKKMAEYDLADRKAQKGNTAYQDMLNEYSHDSALRHEHAVELQQRADQLKADIAIREGLRKDIQQTVAKWCEACRSEDPTELFSMAQWVHRRAQPAPGRVESVAAGAGLLEELARKLDGRAGGTGPQS